MIIAEFIDKLNNMNYFDLFKQMIPGKPETWFLPPGYQILRKVHSSGCVNILFYIPTMGNPASATGDLFNCIVRAHEHYQEGLLIQKLNSQAKL